jgi:hypothetical protein
MAQLRAWTLLWAVVLVPFAAAGQAPAAAAEPALLDEGLADEASRGLVFGTPDLSAEFHGFVAFEFFAFHNDPARPNPSFDIHNFFFSTHATIGSSISVFGEVEYEHGSQVKLDRAFIEWAASEAFILRAGRFSVPLSYERVHYRAPARLTTSRMLGVDLAFHEWSDNGLEATGRYGWFGYDVALVNGPTGLTEAGIPNFDEIDINRNKTVVVRLNAFPVSELEVGVAGAYGFYDAEGQRSFVLVEADARFRKGPWDIWFEADWRNAPSEPCSPADDAACPASYAGAHGNLLSFYGIVSYAALHGRPGIHYLRPLVRYDELHDLVDGAVERRVTVGLNWSPRSHFVLKTEYQLPFTQGQPAFTQHGFMASAVADF